MTARVSAAAVAACLALPCPPASAADEDALSAAEVAELLTGNTLTGRYSNGNPYSEHHAPNGVVYGHNNRRPVVNGCWELRGSLACYYYAEDRQRGPFCWSFRRLAPNGYQATLVGREDVAIVAVLEKGNPHRHSDNGRPWTCEPLQSHRTTPRERHALRADR
jgi:hypothetical protein